MDREPKEKLPERNIIPVTRAILVLEKYVQEIVTVTEWSRKLGYDDPVTFSNDFRQAFRVRPQPVLLSYRALNIVEKLRLNNHTNYEIALDFNLRDERGLYQFIKRKTGYAPNDIGELSDQEYNKLLKKLDKKIIEQN